MNAAQGSAGEQNARISGTVPWCSGLAYVPVKDEIAGSNPVGTAESLSSMPATVTATSGITAGWSHQNDAPHRRPRVRCEDSPKGVAPPSRGPTPP
jgi:hypothetical protein